MRWTEQGKEQATTRFVVLMVLTALILGVLASSAMAVERRKGKCTKVVANIQYGSKKDPRCTLFVQKVGNKSVRYLVRDNMISGGTWRTMRNRTITVNYQGFRPIMVKYKGKKYLFATSVWN
jgi:hypothetical protein